MDEIKITKGSEDIMKFQNARNKTRILQNFREKKSQKFG